jgi:hypothetical protein
MAAASEGGRAGVGAGAALVLCIGLSALSATLLHLAPERAWASGVAPIGLIWAGAAMVAALAGPPRTALLIVAAAVAARAPLIGTPALLSDDVYRYLFEGRALLAGHNPFVSPPAALAGFEEPLRALVNHPEIPTIYPPVALGWFVALGALGAGVTGAQALAALADVATVGALIAAGPTARRGALLYALHPLAALESASGAHLEAPAVALAAWACVWGRGGPALGLLAAGTKLLPIALLPPLARRAGPLWTTVGALAAGAALIALTWPVLDAGPALLDAFTNYARRWSFNGFSWPAARWLLGDVGGRIALASAGAVAAAVAWWWAGDRPAVAWLAIATAFLLITPTAHPWYALWMLAPAAMLGRWGAAFASSGLLSGYLVLFTYDARTGAWSEPAWLWAATWGPVAIGLAWEVARVARSRAPRAPISE